MPSQDICVSLELTFGNIPELIFDNIQYFTYDYKYDHFTCVPCNAIIKLVRHNEHSTTINFRQHLLSMTHKTNTISIDEVWSKLMFTFRDRIPTIVENNMWLFCVNGNIYECVICEKKIPVSKCTLIQEENFSNHLLSHGHKKNFEECMENIRQLQLIYGRIPDIILNNKQFLSYNWSDENYSCTICEEIIEVNVDDWYKTVENFKDHLSDRSHMKKAKQANAFSKIPELRIIFCYLPNYILRNVHYINTNETGDIFSYYCTLCCENITFQEDNPFEFEQNCKYHFFSELHEQNLFNRRNPNNEVFTKFNEHFDSFPEDVVDQLKYISSDGFNFKCIICDIIIDESEFVKESEENILNHFESNHHITVLENEMVRRGLVLHDFNELFGNIPDVIRDNIIHIDFKGMNTFECVLCRKVLKCKCDSDYEQNTSVTEDEFTKHLNSKTHIKNLKELDDINQELEQGLAELFIHIPQCIMNNLYYIGYKSHSDDFFCHLCRETIAIVDGTEEEDLTLLHFRNHLLSAKHSFEVKREANKISKITKKLDYIFGRVPNVILNNVQHIVTNGDHFYCTLCNAQLELGSFVETSEHNILKHLWGYRHRQNEKFLEQETDQGFHELDCIFWRIPEFLLRNIDYLSISGDDLFCTLCQIDLPFDVDDLENTKLNLRCHMDSEIHQYNLEPY